MTNSEDVMMNSQLFIAKKSALFIARANQDDQKWEHPDEKNDNRRQESSTCEHM
jgi:hypothetical protein